MSASRTGEEVRCCPPLCIDRRRERREYIGVGCEVQELGKVLAGAFVLIGVVGELGLGRATLAEVLQSLEEVEGDTVDAATTATSTVNASPVLGRGGGGVVGSGALVGALAELGGGSDGTEVALLWVETSYQEVRQYERGQ